MAATTATPQTAPTIRAAILSSELDASLLQPMKDALAAAGFAEVVTFDNISQVLQPPDAQTGRSCLAPSLRGKMLIVMDERIDGRAALEVHAILKAAPELEGPRFLLFLAKPTGDEAVFAAWKAGIDCVLTKPFIMEEFANFAQRLYDKLAGEQPGTEA